MQYVVMRRKAEEDVDLFSDNDEDAEVINPITPEQYQTDVYKRQLIRSVKVVFIQYRFQKSRLCTVSFFPYPIE